MNLKIPKSIINTKDPTLLITFIAVEIITLSTAGPALITPDSISYFIYTNPHLHSEDHAKALNELRKMQYINKVANGEYAAPSSNFYFTSNYVIIDSNNLEVFLCTSKHNMIDLILHYCYLLSTINNKTQYGFATINKMSEIFNVHRKTIIERNKFLEDNNLITFSHQTDHTPNHYSTPDSYELLDHKKINNDLYELLDTTIAFENDNPFG